MSQPVYCSNCGKRLNVLLKAMPKYGTIVRLVEYHECTPEPMELDLTPVDVPVFKPTEGKDKFVKKLNDLNPSPNIGGISTEHLRDRRFDVEEKKVKGAEIKSTAPESLLNQLKSLENSIPASSLEEPESEE